MTRNTVVICVLTTSTLACARNDGELLVNATEAPIGVGALYSFNAGDACRSARFSGCSTDKLLEWKELTSSNANVVKPRRVGDLPENLRLDGYPWVLEGMSPGSAAVTLTATFDDGSERESTFDVTVDAPASAQFSGPCETRLYPRGATVRLGVKFKSASGAGLVGLVPDSAEGDGITENFSHYIGTGYLWNSSVAASTTLRSARFPAADIELRSYAPEEMNIVDVGLAEGHHVTKRGSATLLRITANIGGVAPCELSAMQARSDTPSVCLYEGVSENWAVPGETTTITPLESGTCTISIAPEGTDKWKEFSFTYELQ
jgi:hypothetical protein